MVIRATRRQVHNQDSWKVHHRELDFGKVERYIRIPSDADVYQSFATFEDGVLKFSIPKKTTTPPFVRSIQIS